MWLLINKADISTPETHTGVTQAIVNTDNVMAIATNGVKTVLQFGHGYLTTDESLESIYDRIRTG